MDIRPMIAGDRLPLLDMLDNTPEFNANDRAVAMEVIDDYLAEPVSSGYNIMVAVEDSNIAGYVSFGLNPMTQATWDIYWLAVAPESQNKGLGRQLITTAEKSIQAEGGKLVILEVSSLPANERVHRFYRSVGYQYVFSIKDFYGPGDDKVTYEKRL